MEVHAAASRYGSMLVRVEQAYGVPGSVLVAIWGLETDFGSNIGTFPTLRSVTTTTRKQLVRVSLPWVPVDWTQPTIPS